MTGKRLDARRVYSAAVLLPLFYLLVRYGPPIGFFLLALAAALLAMTEFYRLSFGERTSPLDVSLGLGYGGAILAAMYWSALPSIPLILTIGLMTFLTVRLLRADALQHCLTDAAVLLLGVSYVGLLLGHLLLTRALPDGHWLILFLFFVTWAGDTGAYYAGTALGKRQLAPRISPKKTVEGFVGGVTLGVLVAFLAGHWLVPSFSPGDCLALGLLLSLAGLLGDLAESALKRGAGVKDSGSLIPGHGGMLDRLDSLLFTAPTFYYYVTLIKG
jgi:phosphatidate cytidylyltransferase